MGAARRRQTIASAPSAPFGPSSLALAVTPPVRVTGDVGRAQNLTERAGDTAKAPLLNSCQLPVQEGRDTPHCGVIDNTHASLNLPEQSCEGVARDLDASMTVVTNFLQHPCCDPSRMGHPCDRVPRPEDQIPPSNQRVRWAGSCRPPLRVAGSSFPPPGGRVAEREVAQAPLQLSQTGDAITMTNRTHPDDDKYLGRHSKTSWASSSP